MAVQDNNTQTLLRTKNTIYGGGGTCNETVLLEPKVVIKCGKEEFVVNRSALCRFSKKLGTMSDQIEPSQEWEINMTNVPKDSLRKLLEFVQSNGDARIFNNLPSSTLFSLMSLAHAMEMIEIETELFFVILGNSCSCSIIAYLWDLAQKYKNVEASKKIIRYIYDHVNDMLAKGFFKAITWEQVFSLIKGVRKDLPLDNLCLAVIQWLKMDPSQKGHAAVVARHLDWKRISNDVICRLVFTEPLFRRILKLAFVNNVWYPPPVVRSALAQYKQQHLQTLASEGSGLSKPLEANLIKNKFEAYAVAWKQNLPIQQLQTPWLSATIRKPTIKKPAILVFGATRQNSLAIQVYFVKSRSWVVPLDTAMQGRRSFGCAYHGGKLYVIGGNRGDDHIYEQCFAINIASGHVEELAAMYHPRCKPSVAATASELFVMGGLNEKLEAVSVALSYPLTVPYRIWKPLKPMTKKRFSCGVVVDPYGQIIVIGGHSCSCEYYNKQGWIDMVSLPQPYSNYGMCAVYLNQLVYAFRTYNPTEVCVFDMIRSGLTILPTGGIPPVQISSMCRFGNEFWALTPHGRFFIYYVTTNFWKMTHLKSTEMCRFFFATIIDEEDVRAIQKPTSKSVK